MLKVLDRAREDNVAATDEAGLTLDEVAREGARRMLAAALEAEVEHYIEAHADARDAAGRRQVVRNGRAQSRTVTCGAGTLQVRAPRVNDRRVDDAGERRRFTSRILPPYMRRSPQVAEVLPVLYLRGLSTGDFREALPVLLGEDAAGLSPTNITRLTAAWNEEYQAFRRRDLSECDFIYVWVDGIHFNIRLEDDRLCTLVVLGVRSDGTKELVAIEDGYRESAESWASVLRDLRRRGLRAPVMAVGDGALGFWSAVRDVWPETTPQRDWCHKMANVLDKLPKRLRPRAKRALREVMYAATRADAETAVGAFVDEFEAKYPKATGCLVEDQEALLAFLRHAGRALVAPADVESDRIAVRDGAAAAACDEGGGLAHQRTPDGLQAAGDGAAAVAPTERGAVAPLGACRRPVRRWRARGTGPDGNGGSEGSCLTHVKAGSPGGPGWFPTSGSHRSVRAGLPHTAPRFMDSLP